MPEPRRRGTPRSRESGAARGTRRTGGTAGRTRTGRGTARAGRPAGAAGGHGPVIGAAVGVGLILVVVVLVLATTDGDDGPATVPETAKENGAAVPGGGPPAKAPPTPLTDAEREQVRETVERLALREKEAVRLKDEGFRAQNVQDYETAQAKWTEARDILSDMIGEAETLFSRIGEKRVERYASHYYRAVGEWPQILSDIIKQLR